MPVSIRFVALVSSNNSPLYIKSFDSQQEKDLLRYHFLSHMALDYVLTQLSQTATTKDYALLLVHDGMAVYGSLTNTNIKILIGTDAQEGVRFDLRTTFRSIHKAYISYVCNPFHEVNDQAPIKSKAFDNSIDNFIKAWNSAAVGFM